MKIKIEKLSAVLAAVAVILSPGLIRAQNLLLNGNFSDGPVNFSSAYSYVASGQSAAVTTYGIRASSTDFNSEYVSFGDITPLVPAT